MVAAISSGRLVAAHEATYTAPTSVRLSEDLSMDYAAIYAAQPAVRTVVDFLARNVGQLTLHTFQRLDDSDRKRLRDHPLAKLLGAPNRHTTGSRLIRETQQDRGIYDRALWVRSTNSKTGADELVRLPPEVWKVSGDNWLAPEAFTVKASRGEFDIPAEAAVYFRGYNPRDPRQGMSPIETLRRILAEEWAAGQMREQSLRNGARLSGYLVRPKDAPEWDDIARRRFGGAWRSQYMGQTATEGGGTPILEDGMTFTPVAQTAEQLQYVEARKLTREEVAAAYHIPPPMVGILDNASFSNISEQHKMLYQDTLGPILGEVQDEIALQLIPFYDTTGQVYVEFNMMEKLRGSFEEQAAQLQSSVGAPYLTRNEARARANLPAIEGGDELVVPLNVLVGGLASPTDTAPPQGAIEAAAPRPAVKASGLRVKAAAPASYVAKAREVITAFFRRQSSVVLSRMGAKADWWDDQRWDRELANDLLALSSTVSQGVALRALEALGEDSSVYQQEQTLAYLKVVAAANARSINAATRIELEAALDDDDPDAAARHVFEKATTSRAAVVASTVATAAAGFGTAEAAKQAAAGRTASKTWRVTSGNPRSSHASLDGETVGIDDVFSNGAAWPGDSGALDVEDIANCQCELDITFGEDQQ